jgi:hypothetical protein
MLNHNVDAARSIPAEKVPNHLAIARHISQLFHSQAEKLSQRDQAFQGLYVKPAIALWVSEIVSPIPCSISADSKGG